ncbi:MAG: hypothetical protein ACXVLT_01965 [Flavisolibacter sp.]
MKQIHNQVNNSIQKLISSYKMLYGATALMLILFIAFLLTGCMKQNQADLADNTKTANEQKQSDDLAKTYANTGLSSETLLELQQVKDATGKYHRLDNAFKDGYADINLKLPNMGYHMLKSELASPTFDLKKPAILVYNKKDNGEFDLVAVEYAVPIDWSNPHTPPAGFTGDSDEWDFNTLNTGWWTLHAWVWKFNPDGVFKPMNPDVIVK